LTIDGEERPFYDDEEHENGDENKDGENGETSSDEDEGDEKKKKAGGKREPSKQKAVMDPDHRLLLKNARPLLQSRNSAVRIHFLHISSFISSHLGWEFSSLLGRRVSFFCPFPYSFCEMNA